MSVLPTDDLHVLNVFKTISSLYGIVLQLVASRWSDATRAVIGCEQLAHCAVVIDMPVQLCLQNPVVNGRWFRVS